jgi:hypothetical protein
METLSVRDNVQLRPHNEGDVFALDIVYNHTDVVANVSGSVAQRMYSLFQQYQQGKIKRHEFCCHGAMQYVTGMTDDARDVNESNLWGEKMLIQDGLTRFQKPFGFQVHGDDVVQHTGLILGQTHDGQPLTFHKDGWELDVEIVPWQRVERIMWPQWNGYGTVDKWHVTCFDI